MSGPPESILSTALERLPDGTLVLGFSGGVDSTVALHLLAHCPAARERGVSAIHIDHGLHPDSGRWVRHCHDICQQLAIPLRVHRVDVVPNGDGLEAAARRARWQAYARHLRPADILVLGQHRDDQAETVLLRLLRGAGAAGLAAMRPWSQRRDGLRVWRPLLDVPRTRILDWARDNRLAWLDDPANDDPRHDRNWLRSTLLPMLRERWPQADRTLALSAQRLADAHALERQVGSDLLARAGTDRSQVLRLPPLLEAGRAQRWAVLRLWLADHGAPDIGGARLERIDRELIAAADDATPRIDLGACVLRRHRRQLHLLAPDADRPLRYAFAWDGRAPLALPGGTVMSIEPAPTKPLSLTVASRRGGERMRLHVDRPSRSLKHLLQEAGVPPWLRGRWPVLWLDGAPAGFADLIADARLRSLLGAGAIRLRDAGAAAPVAAID